MKWQFVQYKKHYAYRISLCLAISECDVMAAIIAINVSILCAVFSEFVSELQTQLEQSRLQEAELLGALKEMQDKVLDLEKVCV